MRRLICVLLVIGLVIAVPLIGWIMPGPASTTVEVQIPRGASLARAAHILEQNNIIYNARLFRLFARYLGGNDPIKAGEFAFPSGASNAAVLNILQHGKPVLRLITIAEGMPSILVYEKLMAEPLLTGTISIPDEGSILPDSYSFERGESRAEVVARMQAAMQQALTDLWPARSKRSLVTTTDEAVILASVVEKETGKASERRLIAGVYSNRLRIGMPLQADPTVIYPVTKGKPLGRRILRSELNTDNGYNTYARRGLPVGPIANPGRESLQAVLDPEPTSFLYFVADGTGGHVFAATLPEHQANVEKWYAIRRARGEM